MFFFAKNKTNFCALKFNRNLQVLISSLVPQITPKMKAQKSADTAKPRLHQQTGDNIKLLSHFIHRPKGNDLI